MEVVYVLSNSVALNRKLDAPRTARDEKRRATHNEGKLINIKFFKVVLKYDGKETLCLIYRYLDGTLEYLNTAII